MAALLLQMKDMYAKQSYEHCHQVPSLLRSQVNIQPSVQRGVQKARRWLGHPFTRTTQCFRLLPFPRIHTTLPLGPRRATGGAHLIRSKCCQSPISRRSNFLDVERGPHRRKIQTHQRRRGGTGRSNTRIGRRTTRSHTQGIDCEMDGPKFQVSALAGKSR